MESILTEVTMSGKDFSYKAGSSQVSLEGLREKLFSIYELAQGASLMLHSHIEQFEPDADSEALLKIYLLIAQKITDEVCEVLPDSRPFTQ